VLSCRRFALLHKDQGALQELLPTLGPLLSKLTPPVDTTLLRVPAQASMAAPTLSKEACLSATLARNVVFCLPAQVSLCHGLDGGAAGRRHPARALRLFVKGI
jgi:hypothetical protein